VNSPKCYSRTSPSGHLKERLVRADTTVELVPGIQIEGSQGIQGEKGERATFEGLEQAGCLHVPVKAQ